jgi:hypothetical protein
MRPNTHGVQQAILLGDPEKPGIYLVRAKFPPHVMEDAKEPMWRVVSQEKGI